jgi:anti-sigma factor RsiW
MQHPDEGMIHTWLDGELSAEEAAPLEAHVADCAQCAAAVAEARGLIAGSSRIVSSLDSVPAGVIPAARPTHRPWYSTTQFRAAAALLLIAGSSLLLMRQNEKKGDSIMAVAAPRVVATDAIARESSALVLPQRAAAPRPTVQQPPSVTSSNSAMAGAAPSAPAPVESRRTEPDAANRPLAGIAGRAQMALKSAPQPEVTLDSAAVGAAADQLVVGGDGLKLIRTDSTQAFTQRVFEMPNGIQLIMTERVDMFGSTAQAQPLSAKTLSLPPRPPVVGNAPVVAAPQAKDRVKFSDYRTITWTDNAAGRVYSLTGPFPPDELEKFKALVMKLSK